jgi:hypothetical protein
MPALCVPQLCLAFALLPPLLALLELLLLLLRL